MLVLRCNGLVILKCKIEEQLNLVFIVLEKENRALKRFFNSICYVKWSIMLLKCPFLSIYENRIEKRISEKIFFRSLSEYLRLILLYGTDSMTAKKKSVRKYRFNSNVNMIFKGH